MNILKKIMKNIVRDYTAYTDLAKKYKSDYGYSVEFYDKHFQTKYMIKDKIFIMLPFYSVYCKKKVYPFKMFVTEAEVLVTDDSIFKGHGSIEYIRGFADLNSEEYSIYVDNTEVKLTKVGTEKILKLFPKIKIKIPSQDIEFGRVSIIVYPGICLDLWGHLVANDDITVSIEKLGIDKKIFEIMPEFTFRGKKYLRPTL